MRIVQGIPIVPGLGIGVVRFYRESRDLNPPTAEVIAEEPDWKTEWNRFAQVQEHALNALEALKRRLQGNGPDRERDEFELDDEPTSADAASGLTGSLQGREGEGDSRHSVEEAVTEVMAGLAEMFESLAWEYAQRRTSYIRSAVSSAAPALSEGPERRAVGAGGRWIMAVEELLPSQTDAPAFAHAAGLLTERGSPTSHTAVMARARGIPAVVVPPCCWAELSDGDTVIVDGTKGEIILRPNDETLARYIRQTEGSYDAGACWRDSDPSQAVTMDGHAITVGADVGSVDEAWQAAEVGADGIGMLSTEMLYREFDHPPSEEEERDIYAEIVRVFRDKPLLFRTLEVDRSEPAPWNGSGAGPKPEVHPLFGTRGIRFCLENPDIFRTHLRAIFQAARNRVLVMFPMVTTVIELRRAREILDEVYAELVLENLPVPKTVSIGVTVETPAAALAADKYAPYVHFFCLGTDNLLQFGLGVDRGSACAAQLYMPYHPGMLRMMAEFVRRANDAGKPVVVTGELAGDPLAVALFLGLGVSSFSVAPDNVPRVKSVIRALRVDDARRIVPEVLEAADAEASFGILESWYRQAIGVVV